MELLLPSGMAPPRSIGVSIERTAPVMFAALQENDDADDDEGEEGDQETGGALGVRPRRLMIVLVIVIMTMALGVCYVGRGREFTDLRDIDVLQWGRFYLDKIYFNGVVFA